MAKMLGAKMFLEPLKHEGIDISLDFLELMCLESLT